MNSVQLSRTFHLVTVRGAQPVAFCPEAQSGTQSITRILQSALMAVHLPPLSQASRTSEALPGPAALPDRASPQQVPIKTASSSVHLTHSQITEHAFEKVIPSVCLCRHAGSTVAGHLIYPVADSVQCTHSEGSSASMTSRLLGDAT